jgi:hypothetical protein
MSSLPARRDLRYAEHHERSLRRAKEGRVFTVERKVGRLVESIMDGRVTLADVESADRAMDAAVRSLSGSCVVIADYRRARFLLEEDAAQLTEMYRRHNNHIERSAILVSASSAVAVLQMERVIREARFPSRRAFRDPREAAGWLEEVLAPLERGRLRVVLSLGLP